PGMDQPRLVRQPQASVSPWWSDSPAPDSGGLTPSTEWDACPLRSATARAAHAGDHLDGEPGPRRRANSVLSSPVHDATPAKPSRLRRRAVWRAIADWHVAGLSA